ncbi:hypothetical protein [Frigoriglobus tundricola]|uniref:Uncharacterized protein n=1 Tax=Frigoriglobus tundricola TaxID=2774151 RepID=A0A6M5Z1Z9_9BACT|nr:hypothetical protein [Frigoriglobus tundricola]QJX00219.1 hypothetical protein FTUN_7843 [Frigoriglobus tundricola]
MLTCIALSLALGAPVPPAAPPTPVGPVPRLLEVKPASDGKVTIAVNRTEKQQGAGVMMIAINGNPNGGQFVVQQDVTKSATMPLAEVKGLKVYTADGKEVPVAEAEKQLKAGGTVVVSADGKKVDPRHLKLFRDDVLVLVSPELAVPTGGEVRVGAPNLPVAPGGARPNLQIQLVPAGPAVPAAPPAPPPGK